MLKSIAALLWTALLVLGSPTSEDAAGYLEKLNIKPLPQSSLLASFSFRSSITHAAFESQDFQYFPRALGQILQHSQTKDLHLRFSSGRWDSESWGNRPWNGSREGGTGVELWAWVDAQDEDEFVFMNESLKT